MNRFETKFEIRLEGFGSTWAAFNEIRSISNSRTWDEACDNFSHVEFPSNEGIIETQIEWAKARDNLKKFAQLNKMPQKEALAELETWEEKCEDVTLICTMSTPMNQSPKEVQRRILGNCLEMFLHHFFLAMNLSSPGCCGLLNTSFKIDSDFSPYEINLDSNLIERAWIESLKNGWPEIKNIPLPNTWKWLSNVTAVGQKIARSRTERALFALLHVCRQTFFNPNMLMWLAHMLEALYDTPVTLIHKFLKDRIFLVLGEPTSFKKNFTKKIREFYNLRSEFVHGDLAITRPSAEGDIDEGVMRYDKRLMESIDFALTIGLATLQKQIIEKWKEISFSETYFGNP
jgi:hypothetical protein